MDKSNYRIFCSYSHNDEDKFMNIFQKINSLGYDFWIDRNGIRAGEYFNEEIVEAINGSDIFLAFLSKSYIVKDYCRREFNQAFSENLRIITVCIDDVNESINNNSSFIFSSLAGTNILRYGKGVGDSNEDIDSLSEEIDKAIQGYQFDLVKDLLRKKLSEEYTNNGQYFLSEISPELFTDVEKPDGKIISAQDSDEPTLIKYIKENSYKDNIILYGNGGIGKTVSMLKACQHLLDQGIAACYVPLSKIRPNRTLDQYIENNICGLDLKAQREIKKLMSMKIDDKPNLVLFLDGLNEMPIGMVEGFLKQTIKEDFINSRKGVKIVISTRFMQNYGLEIIKDSFVELKLKSLSKKSILNYFSNRGIEENFSAKILDLFRTPLLIKLYTDVENFRETYKTDKTIELFDNPDTQGKIISNFLQSQMYKARSEDLDWIYYRVILEYLLPSIAYKMYKNDRMYIEADDIWDSIDDIENKEISYDWYYRDELRRQVRSKSNIDTENIFDIMENSLSFIRLTNSDKENKADAYEFFHQSFRDYFIGYYLRNEIMALDKNPDRYGQRTLAIEEYIYDDEILQLLSDIIGEDSGQEDPEMPTTFKNGNIMSITYDNSLIEKIMDLWREKTGPGPQKAVANFVKILSIVRKKDLSNIHFDNLDLRSCNLNGLKFVKWLGDKYIVSYFDGAYINRENFINQGHNDKVNAIVEINDHVFASADEAGNVGFYNLADRKWMKFIKVSDEKICDLAYLANLDELAVLFPSSLHLIYPFSPDKKTIVYENIYFSKAFSKVKYSGEKIAIAYDTEPLMFYDLDGMPVERGASYFGVKSCKNPVRDEIAYTNINDEIYVKVFNDKISRWRDHKSLKSNYLLGNKDDIKNGLYYKKDSIKIVFSKIYNLIYSKDGSRLYADARNRIYEFDTENYSLIAIRNLFATIRALLFIGDKVIISSGSNIFVYDKDYKLEYKIEESKMNRKNNIIKVIKDPESKAYYIQDLQKSIKKLDDKMTQTSHRGKFGNLRGFIKNKEEGKTYLLIEKQGKKSRYLMDNYQMYDYENDQMFDICKYYELIDFYNDIQMEKVNIKGPRLWIFDRENDYEKLEYENYGGFYIYKCSFKNIKGDMASDPNKKLLEMKGGLV